MSKADHDFGGGGVTVIADEDENWPMAELDNEKT